MHPYGYMLHNYRIKKGISQKALAGKVGVLANHLSQVECGLKSAFRQEVQLLIEEALNLSPAECLQLRAAAEVSVTNFSIPKRSQPIEYEIAGFMAKNLEHYPEKFLMIAKLALEAHMQSLNMTR